MNFVNILKSISKTEMYCNVSFQPFSDRYYLYKIPSNLNGKINVNDIAVVTSDGKKVNVFIREVFEKKDLRKHNPDRIKEFSEIERINKKEMDRIRNTPIAIVEYRKGGKKYPYQISRHVGSLNLPAKAIVTKYNGESKLVNVLEVIRESEAVERGFLLPNDIPLGKITGKA